MDRSNILLIVIIALTAGRGAIQLFTGRYTNARTVEKYRSKYTEESIAKWVRIDGLMNILLAAVIGATLARWLGVNIGIITLLVVLGVLLVVYLVLQNIILKKK